MNSAFFSQVRTSRNVVFAILLTAAFLNFVFAAAGQAIARDGLWPAIYGTFGISAIIWVAMLYTISLMLEDPAPQTMSGLDVLVSVLALIMMLVPHKYFPVLVMSGAAAYLFFESTPEQKNLRKAAILLAAITVPLLWGNLLMMAFNETILEIDAFLVSLVSGFERIGNVVINEGENWYVKISKGCSTLSNLSIGVLSWTFFVLFYDRHYRSYRFKWLAVIFLPILVINVFRMTAVLLWPNYYEFLHEGGGADIANLATLAVIVGLSYLGIKRADDPI